MINESVIIFINLDFFCSDNSSTSGTLICHSALCHASRSMCYFAFAFNVVAFSAKNSITSVAPVVLVVILMVESINCFLTSVSVIVLTGVSHNTCSSTCRLSYYNAFIPIVSISVDLDILCVGMRCIVLTSVSSNALLGTSRRCCYRCTILVIKSIDNFLTFGVIATRAILVCGITVFCTCSSLSLYVNKIVIESFKNCLAFDVITARAILVRGITVFGAGSSLAFYINEIVIKSRSYYLAAKQAILGCCTGCVSSLNVVDLCLDLVAVIPAHRVDNAISALIKLNVGRLVASAGIVIFNAVDYEVCSAVRNYNLIIIVITVVINYFAFCARPTVIAVFIPVIYAYVCPEPIVFEVKNYVAIGI